MAFVTACEEMSTEQRWVYRTGEHPPEWCMKGISMFRRDDGSTGIEYYGRYRTYTLEIGDAIIKTGDHITIERGKRYENG